MSVYREVATWYADRPHGLSHNHLFACGIGICSNIGMQLTQPSEFHSVRLTCELAMLNTHTFSVVQLPIGSVLSYIERR